MSVLLSINKKLHFVARHESKNSRARKRGRHKESRPRSDQKAIKWYVTLIAFL